MFRDQRVRPNTRRYYGREEAYLTFRGTAEG